MRFCLSSLGLVFLAGILFLGCGSITDGPTAFGGGFRSPDGSRDMATIGTTPRLLAALENDELLPAYMTEAEKEAAAGRPDWYAFRTASPPQGNVTVPAEFDAIGGVLIRIPLSASTQDFFGRLVNEVADSGVIPYLLIPNAPEAGTVERYFLSPYGTSRSDVEFLYANNDAFWARDFGPYHVYVNGDRAIVDMEYYSTRPYDDYIPIRLGEIFDEDVYSAPLATEGGNFMTDGLGTCWASTGIFKRNDLSTTEAREIYRAYLGCNTVVFVEPLPREGTTHIDMFSKILDRDTILVAYSNSSLGANATQIRHLDGVADDYAATPKPGGGSWNIVRIPMAINNSQEIFYAYTNSLIVNGTVIVPTYSRPTDAMAMQIYRDAMSGYRVVSVESSDIIGLGGSVHCTTMQIPRDSSNNEGYCGDGHVDSGEVCDGGTVACTALGNNYAGGNASCNSTCSGWNTSRCTSSSTDEITLQFDGQVTEGNHVVIDNGLFEATAGDFRAAMTGSHDADLYVWKNVSSPTWSNYSCRPYLDGSNETCEFKGPGVFLVVVRGYAATSSYNIEVTYTP